MPKQLQELRSFNVGTIMNADSTDLPLEAASYSLDIDSVTEDGKLKGRPDDVEISLSDSLDEPQPIVPSGGIGYVLIDDIERLVISTANGWVLCSTDINATSYI